MVDDLFSKEFSMVWVKELKVLKQDSEEGGEIRNDEKEDRDEDDKDKKDKQR